MISLELDADVVPPGGTLRGRVVARTESGQAPRAVVIDAGWRTEGRGSSDNKDVVSVRLEPEGRTPRGGSAEVDEELPGSVASSAPRRLRPSLRSGLEFEIAIPATGPCSYDGKLLRIIWELRVRLDILWGRDETIARTFVVSCGA